MSHSEQGKRESGESTTEREETRKQKLSGIFEEVKCNMTGLGEEKGEMRQRLEGKMGYKSKGPCAIYN